MAELDGIGPACALLEQKSNGDDDDRRCNLDWIGQVSRANAAEDHIQYPGNNRALLCLDHPVLHLVIIPF